MNCKNTSSIASKIFKISRDAKVPVKVGSYKLAVPVTELTTAAQLVKRVLDECNLANPSASQGSKCYVLFERYHGVERQVHKSEAVLTLWSKWNAKCPGEMEFIVRLCKKLGNKMSKEVKVRNAKCAFDSWKKTQAPAEPVHDVTHIYEQLDASAEVTIADIKSYIAQKRVRFTTPQKSALPSFHHHHQTETTFGPKVTVNNVSIIRSGQAKKMVKLENSVVKHVKSMKRLYNELMVNYNIHQTCIESERLYPLGDL